MRRDRRRRGRVRVVRRRRPPTRWSYSAARRSRGSRTIARVSRSRMSGFGGACISDGPGAPARPVEPAAAASCATSNARELTADDDKQSRFRSIHPLPPVRDSTRGSSDLATCLLTLASATKHTTIARGDQREVRGAAAKRQRPRPGIAADDRARSTDRRRRAHAGRAHGARVHVRRQRVHRRLDRVDEAAGDRQHDHDRRERRVDRDRHHAERHRAGDGADVIVSIAARDPMRDITAPLASAPTTPPRLKAVMPLLATLGPKPAPASTVGSQLKPR